ncbi:serine/threonine protein kinase, partial [Pelomonas saccharophila]
MATGPVSPSSAAEHDDHSLPVGTRLGEFEITHRIGEGGFSVVYLAWDHSLDRKVALKEYMPASIAVRGGKTQVGPRSERLRDTFDAGLKSFINEAKLLAQFEHRSLVKVYRFWEANGTAYMVMPFYQGSTVRDTVRQMPGPPDEAWIGGLLRPLAEALQVIHEAQCYHRDIAPDNVLLLAETGQPLLLDFGAARRVVGGMTQALTVILKPGYAPIEQYDEIPGMKQGPWTDVYALAAVVHWLITSKTPPPSVGRVLNDTYVPLTTAAAGRYSERFLAATDRALTVLPDRRTPSIQAFLADLGLLAPASAMPTTQLLAEDDEITIIRPPAVAREPAATATRQPTSTPATVQTGSTAAGSLKTRLVIGGAAIAAALAAGGWWLARPPAPTSAKPLPAKQEVPAEEKPLVAAPAPVAGPPPSVAPTPAPEP